MSTSLDELMQNWYTVVGVAGDVRDQNLDSDPAELVYYPMTLLEDQGGMIGTSGSRCAPRSIPSPWREP